LRNQVSAVLFIAVQDLNNFRHVDDKLAIKLIKKL